MDARTRLLLAAILLAVVRSGQAQNVPPFFGAGTAYDPQVSVINSGALLDAQATVSADQKHVTLNMRPQQNSLQSLARFPVVTSSGGFVGGAVFSSDPPASPAAARAPSPAAKLQSSPAAIERAANSWILTRQGMFLVSPLK